MPEAGGPTTQSGIYYQNSIAALFVGQLLGGGPPGLRRVIAVHVEAPEDVDDTVVTFEDGGRDFIQSKETLTSADAWRKIWSDFHAQRARTSFDDSRDALVLMVGEPSGRAAALRDMTRRSEGTSSDRTWLERLNNDQRDLVTSVERALPAGSTTGDVFRIFRRLRVEVRTIEEIEAERAVVLLPETTKDRGELLRLLRDRVQSRARHRVPFTRDELVKELEGEDPTFRLLSVPAIPALRDAVRAAGSVLRAQKRGVGPAARHIVRPATGELVAWLRSDESANTIAMLTDDAGRGKTVVMADVLDALEENDVTVVAMKADAQLAAVTNADDIARALHLPDSLERVVTALAAREPVVILIDQIDALSHNLARDPKTLDAVLDLAARLRGIAHVRIAISCRAFDRATDRRLRSLDVKKDVTLGEFSADEVKETLASVDIAFDALTPATQALLRTPLHLELFVWLKTSGGRPEDTSPSALQDLYAALVTDIALKLVPDAPPVAHRDHVLLAMTTFMAAHQRSSTPLSYVHGVDPEGRATAWLASHGLIVVTNGAATFLHQTLFDYLFARQFVDSGTSLVEHLRASSQALRQRTELVQVLTYARSTVPATYIRWLNALWHDPAIRPHLRRLLVRWFAALRVPTKEDVAWATARLGDPADRVELLQAFFGNAAWFSALVPVLRVLLHDTDDAVVDAVVMFVASVASAAPADVAEVLRPFIGGGDAWKTRLWSVVNWIHTWAAPETVEFFAEVAAAHPPPGFSHFVGFEEMAHSNPSAFARIVRSFLDRCVERAMERDDPAFAFLSHVFDELQLTDFDDALEAFAADEPSLFIDTLLPWYEGVLRRTPESTKKEMFFAYDHFAFTWREDVHRTHDAITTGLIRALGWEAKHAPENFDCHTTTLAAIDAASAQWIVASVLTDLPERADDALRFLLSDLRRFHLGKALEITTALIRAAVPHAPWEAVKTLERQILAYRGYHEPEDIEDLRRQGLDQYLLLAQFPIERLTVDGRRRLGELARKFPTASLDPQKHTPSVVMRWEASPIAPERAAKMSDEDWLRAMAKHRKDDGMIERSPRQLGEILKQRAEEEPGRFGALLDRIPDGVPLAYVKALIQSLGESAGALPQPVLRAVRRFAPAADLDLRRMIAWTLRKHPSDIPADILNILESWVRDPSLDTPHDARSLDYLNPDRGASFLALMSALRTRDTAEAHARRWSVFAYVAQQDAAFLRAAAIEELRHELFEDTERALDMFDALSRAKSEVLTGHYVDDFIRLALGRRAARVLPMIVEASGSADGKVRERAAFLGAIAAVSPLVVTGEELARARKLVAMVLMSDDETARIAVTRVLAHNIDGPSAAYCIQTLTQVLADNSKDVRKAIANVFSDDTAAALLAHRPFLRAYVASLAIVEAQHQWEDFLLEHAGLDPAFGLDLIECALPRLDTGSSPRFGDDLLRYVLRVIVSARGDDKFESRAMDVFDALDARYGRFASNILAEWDRP